MRASTLGNNVLAINREIDSRYDAVIAVRDKLPEIELVAGMDLDALIAELENAQDFTGITVVSGTEVAWDAVNKVLTVPKGKQGVKGDKGDKGDIGLQGPQGPRGAQGPQGLKGDIGPNGPRGLNGPKGDSGKDGKDGKDLTVDQIVYNNNGTFTWIFSDGTNYVTPNLKGDQGAAGDKGDKGDQGVSVHHMKGTSTTDPEGDFSTAGELDTYTFYTDADELFPLAWFTVKNGEDPWRRAVDRGYRGTEEEFYTLLASVEEYATIALESINITEENKQIVIEQAQIVAADKLIVEQNMNTTISNREQTDLVLEYINSILLGNKVEDPLVDNNGDTLTIGSMYYNTTENAFKVWSGIKWFATTFTFNGRAGEVVLLNSDITSAVGRDVADALNTIDLAIANEVSKTNNHIVDISNPHNVTKSQVGLGNADNTADADKVVASAGRLTEGKKINDVVFDNTQDITITANTPNSSAISFDSGTEEGTDVYTFDGSEAKSVDIVAGLNVELVKEAGKITINVDDTEVNWDEIQNVPSPTITLSGDVSGSAVMTELGSTSLEVTIQPNSVELGVDTTGNYVGDITGGEGITVTGAKGENWIPEVSITPVGVAGTYTKVTTNDKGQVISGGSLSPTDIPDIDASKITSGVIDAARLPAYVDDVLEYANLSAFPAVGEAGKIYIALDTNKAYRWSGSTYVYITSGAVDSVAGKTGVVTLVKADVGLANVDNTSDVNKPISTATQTALNTKVELTENQTIEGVKTFSSTIIGNISGNSATATKLQTARTINDVAFDGTANIVAPTNLSITNGTTAGFTIVSSSGTNVVVPTASATISGVVTTGNQTIAGIKTFNSSPIVPVPTTDFQSVPLKSTNITVNVGTGQTYTTINQALEYLSGFYPMYKKSGIVATINLKAGFVMAEQVLVSGIDLGWITIVGEDAETIITHTYLTTGFNGAHYPAFGVDKGGTSPVIGQLFRFNVEKVGGDKHGLMTWGAGSSSTILPNKGFIGAGTFGILATYSSTVNAQEANCSNAGDTGIGVSYSATVNANKANCSNAGNNGIGVFYSSIANINNANCSNAGTNGILASNNSAVNANGANASNAGTNGIFANGASIINAFGVIIQNQTTGTARIRVGDGSTIESTGINTNGGTVPALSQTANTLTGNGIIYQ